MLSFCRGEALPFFFTGKWWGMTYFSGKEWGITIFTEYAWRSTYFHWAGVRPFCFHWRGLSTFFRWAGVSTFFHWAGVSTFFTGQGWGRARFHWVGVRMGLFSASRSERVLFMLLGWGSAGFLCKGKGDESTFFSPCSGWKSTCLFCKGDGVIPSSCRGILSCVLTTIYSFQMSRFKVKKHADIVLVLCAPGDRMQERKCLEARKMYLVSWLKSLEI